MHIFQYVYETSKLCPFQSLGDVAEVSYVHSNQNVVGSSKAENQMSRWAVRDVFELQQFSQLPANVAVYSPKVKRRLFKKNVFWVFFLIASVFYSAFHFWLL